MDRRHFLRAGVVSTGAGVMLPTAMFARPASARSTQGSATPGESPYGPLSDTPDENGLLLPAGFTSRVVAMAGEAVGATSYVWHLFPDGAATFDDGNGGWYYVCNSELRNSMLPNAGGVSAIHFAADGSVIDAYRILDGSVANCAGGPTPWGTWLSGEEYELGRLWECDPTGEKPAVRRDAMGVWSHEAAAVDPVDEIVYITQDDGKGLLYRFIPTSYPDLSAGVVEACIIDANGAVSWGVVADPSGVSAPTKKQVAGARVFAGGEGIWYHNDWIYFTTKLDHSVHAINLRAQKYHLVWKGDPSGLGVEGAVLSHVDNITVDSGSGDLYVAEDGGNMELCIITPDGFVAPFVRVVGNGHGGSEMTGPVFNPTNERLYFSSQRGPNKKTAAEILPGIAGVAGGAFGGVTYEITGPFRGVPPITDAAPPETEAPITSPVDTLVGALPETEAPIASPVDTLFGAAPILTNLPVTGGAFTGVQPLATLIVSMGMAVLYILRRRVARGIDPTSIENPMSDWRG